MSSSTIFVSLCVIRIEINDLESEQSADAATVKKMRGFREPREITIESYFSASHEPFPLLDSQGFIKSCKQSQTTSEQILCDTNVTECNATCISLDQTNVFSQELFHETTKGILHLFKEDELTEMHCAADRSHTVCILSVPATMTYQDILNFTAAFHRDIQHFRMLRDSSPNQYMTLITFHTSTAASEFYETFNGAPYGFVEPDVACHLVFVSKVEIANNGLPIAGHTELPSCPICLERMDESVDGILTILCNYSFQSSCLYNYEEETSCPVCRCAQSTESLSEKCCMQCERSNEDVWICLICGNLGCSRYDSGHAFKHYQDTHHCYAMQLGNNRVWDYVRDNFVHRLLQNKDGKMVDSSQESAKSEGAAVDEKIDSVQLEFTYLLTSQLETQRKYFEERINRLEQHTTVETKELKTKLDQILKDNSQMLERVTQINREKQALEKKLHSSNNKLSQIQTELVEEKELRKALNMNQTTWQLKHKKLQDEVAEYKNSKETEVIDLREQVRDLMFFLEAQKQIENSSNKEEIASGRIVIGPQLNSTNTKNSPKKHGKGKR